MKTPPQKRLKDVTAARQFWSSIWKNGEKRRQIQSEVRNQLEGGRPFDPAKQMAAGLGWQTNVNFGDASAAFNRTLTPYWKMVHDVPNKAAITVHSQAPRADQWAKAFQECFDLFLKDWGVDYISNFMMVCEDFVKFGPGLGLWTTADSPRYTHARIEKVALPKKAKISSTSWEAFGLKGEMSTSDLWAKIRDNKKKDQSEYVGWNSKAVEAAIKKLSDNANSGSSRMEWPQIQDELVSNDMGKSEEWGSLDVIHLFVKEYDDSITYMVFADTEDLPDYLYLKKNYAKAFSEVVGTLFFEMGTAGLYHSVKGFGVKNYYFSVMLNRLKSRLMDAATITMGLNFKQTTETPNETPPVQNYSCFNVFPQGLEQFTVYPQLAAGQSVIDALSANNAENNAMYREQSKQIADTTTARQAVILANLSEEVGAATASLYLAQMAKWFEEMVRRLRKKGSTDPDAKKFVKRMKERGVPVEVIHTTEISVETGASPGTAGAALRDMIAKELLGLVNMPGMNKRAVLEFYVSNRTGAAGVGKYMLREGQDSMPAQRRLAMMENNSFGQGMPLPVDPADAHLEHLDEHLKPLEQMAQAFQQTGQTRPEWVSALEVTLQHAAQHLELMAQDETMKNEYKQMKARLSNVNSVGQAMVKFVQQQAQQQPQLN